MICEGVKKFSHDFTICGKRISLTKKFVNKLNKKMNQFEHAILYGNELEQIGRASCRERV